MTLTPGTKLGPYEMLAPIGAGAMGEVWRARDPRLGRDVAIKVLPEAFAGDADRLQRFETEARAAGALAHPNILVVYDAGVQDGTPYVVMELLEGSTLRDKLAAGPIVPRRAAEWAAQIAAGLAAAHESGVLHRDLKPENLFVTRDGRVKILDFGLARLAGPRGASGSGDSLTAAMTETGMLLGTAGYMAPEQARGHAADARSDLFALGVVLYEMLSGRRAFKGDSAVETMAAVLQKEPPPLSPEVPLALQRITTRLLEKEPAMRFQSARDLSFALEGLAEPSAQTLTGGLAQGPASAGRARGLDTRALAAGLALGALIASGAWFVLRPAPTEPVRTTEFTFSGRDDNPALSPDGRLLAYSSRRDGTDRIWLRQIEGGNEVPLTPGTNPSFTRDGQSILYALHSDSMRFVADADIYRIGALGGTPSRILSHAALAEEDPLRDRLAWVHMDFAPGGTTLVAGITVGDLDGSRPRLLRRVENNFPVALHWSPDGRQLGWVSPATQGGTGGTLTIVDAETGQARDSLTRLPSGGLLQDFAWNGGGSVLLSVVDYAFSSRTPPSHLVLWTPGTRRFRTLLNESAVLAAPVVAGNGEMFYTRVSNRSELVERDLAAPDTQRVLTRGNASERQPFYSNDGRAVIFASTRGGDSDLWRLELASGQLARLTHDPGDDWDPYLTPDGARLLWSSNRTGAYEIWTANGDGSEPRQLSHDGVDAENPAQIADGWIIYNSANPARAGLHRIRPDGSGDSLVVTTSTLIPDASHDGRWVSWIDLVASRVSIAATANWRAAPKSFPFHTEYVFTVNQMGRHRWLPGDRSILFLNGESGERAGLWLQEVGTDGTPSAPARRVVEGSVENSIESFGIAPDGRHVVLSNITGSKSIVHATSIPEVVGLRRRP